jgi:hypothetical protein
MLLSNNRRQTDSIDKRNKMLEEEKELQTKIKSLEIFLQRTLVDIGEEFPIKVHEAIMSLTNTTKIIVTTALFQADAVMASNIINNKSEILLTSDSDQAAILGPKCISIKNFKIKETIDQTIIENIEIFVANKNVMEETISMLYLPNDSEKLVNARYPVFDDVDCPRVRALIAVALGCDVNLNSIITPAPLLSFLQSDFF